MPPISEQSLRTIPDFMLILISSSFPWEFLSDVNNTFQLQTVLPHKISWKAIALVYITFPHVILKKVLVLFQIFLQPGISCNSTTWKANLSPIFPFLDHPDIKTWSSHYRLPMKLNVSLFISWILNGILHWIFYANYHDLMVTGPEIWGIQIL